MPLLNPGALIQGIPGATFLSRVRQPGFFRNVLVVMTGTALAQVISFAISPLISRLFGPADFGVFGTYLSVAGVLGVAATLNYTDALMIPAKNEDAAALFLFACLATTVVALLTMIFCLLAPVGCLQAVGMGGLRGYLWVLPVSVFFLGFVQCLAAWCSRLKAFEATSHGQVVRSVTAGTTQVTTGFAGLGGLGLIGGSIVAEACTAAFLLRAILVRGGAILRECARWNLLWNQAREYREFAAYGCPQNVMNALSQGIPVLILAHYYGLIVAGSYAFGIRLLQVPMNFFLTSIRQVLFQKLSQISVEGRDLYSAFVKSTSLLVAVSFIPACVGFVAAPSVFAFVFGEQWREAGHFARWLILWLAPMFCNVPASLAARVLRLQRSLFLFDLVLLSARTATLVLGGLRLRPLETIIALSIVGALFNVFFILFVALKIRKRSPVDQVTR